MILLPLNENAEILPNVPLWRPLYVAPSDSAASSINGTPYCVAQLHDRIHVGALAIEIDDHHRLAAVARCALPR